MPAPSTTIVWMEAGTKIGTEDTLSGRLAHLQTVEEKRNKALLAALNTLSPEDKMLKASLVALSRSGPAVEAFQVTVKEPGAPVP
jgi:hypothetical protein